MYGTEKKVMKLPESETRSRGDLGECREKMRKEIQRAALILMNIHVDSDTSGVVQLLPIPAALYQLSPRLAVGGAVEHRILGVLRR